MPDVMTVVQRSELMSRIRAKNTSPEIKLRRAAWSIGLRYRLHYRIGRFKPDLVFIKKRVAIFIDGCFWHHCPLHGVMPKGNHAFWKQKIDGNVARDRETTIRLVSEGWEVLRIWEHEVDEDPQSCAQRIAEVLNGR